MATFSETSEEARGRRDLTLAAVFFLLSLVVLYLPQGVQGQVAAGLRATVLRPFLFTQEVLTQARLRAEESGRLQLQLDSLAAEIAAQAPVLDENRRLHELLELKTRAPGAFQPASVIRPGTPGSESMFLLDVGSEEGVRSGDPVIMRGGRIGLVGVVQQVRRGSSIGLDWSHPEFRASAMNADATVFGMVQPVRGMFREEDRLLLDGTPYTESLSPGALIVTSGLGGIFPRGIPIGTVEGVAEAEGGWRKSYWLRPVVEMGSVTHALVVLGDGVAEGIFESFLESGGGSSTSEPGDPVGGGVIRP